jgi:UDP-2,3-diacylglucosamine pyrophosphatase LpxH
MEKRDIDVLVLSDLHLGTFGCHAQEIVTYLKSVAPKVLVLNGDIIDIWQLKKHYFPAAHMQVIKQIFSLLSKGTKVYYITGNHDEALRRYTDLEMGGFTLTDKVVLELDGKKTWIFHGDIFDATTKGSAKIIAKLGGHGYDLLIMLNSAINWALKLMGKEKMSFSKKVKNSVKKAVSWIGNFEQTAAELAIQQGYDYVICGHIHQPQKRMVTNEHGSVMYLNSGDWIENLTALEYVNGEWNIHQYNEKEQAAKVVPILSAENKLPELNVLTKDVALFFNSLIAQ